ncbi:MAG: hypothetical protein AAF598_09625 [Bacteroidota bacterium]
MSITTKGGKRTPQFFRGIADNQVSFSKRTVFSVLEFRLGFFKQLEGLFKGLDSLDNDFEKAQAIQELPETISVYYASYLEGNWNYEEEQQKFLLLKSCLLDMSPTRIYALLNHPEFPSWSLEALADRLNF